MNFTKTCVVSVHNNQKNPPPLPSMPPPSTNMLHKSLTPPALPPPPPPPPPLLPTNQNNNSSLSSYSSSSASSTSSQGSNYLQPKITNRNNPNSDSANHCESPQSCGYSDNGKVYNSSSCSFSTNNLTRMKFNNISNQQLNNQMNSLYQKGQHSQYQKPQYYPQYQPVNTSSMRNINEIVNNSKPQLLGNHSSGSNNNSKEEQNYSNLQQALRAATAALQKSKASTNLLTSQQNLSKSNINLTNLNQQRNSKLFTSGAESSCDLSFQLYTKPQLPLSQQFSNSGVIQETNHNNNNNNNSSNRNVFKNTLNLLIENEKSQENLKSNYIHGLKAKQDQSSDYDNIEDNIDISVNLNCLNSNLLNQQQQDSKLLKLKSTDEISLLDETGKANSHQKLTNQENETISTLSSPSSMSSSKSSTTSESSASSLSAKLSHVSTKQPLNISELSSSSQNNNSIFQSKRSAFSSALNLNEKKFNDYFYGYNLAHGSHNNVYRENGIDVDETNDGNNLNAHMAKFFNKNLTTTKQKSASIDHLNLASCFNKNSKVSDNSNNLINKDLNEDCEDEANNSQESTKRMNCLPPPNIQPFSGVLSKSLHSLVLKPQPLKPIIEQAGSNKKNNNVTIIKPTVGGKGGSCFSNQQYHHMKPLSTTSSSSTTAQPLASSYRDNFFKSKCASTTNLFTDLKSCHVSHPTTVKKAFAAKSVNFLASKLSESESSLNDDDDDDDGEDVDDSTSSTTSENVGQFEIVVDSNKTKSIEPISNSADQIRDKNNIETERLAYELKLNEMRVHFNQKLSMFEDNERKIMQDRINTLQSMYNDLKFNFQKNLENDVKSLRSQLSDSQNYSAKLINELNKCTCLKEPLSNSTTQTDSIQTPDLSFELKKAKIENNELKLKLDSERRQFHVERDKWLNEKQKVIQFQNYLQQQRELNESNFIANGHKSSTELPSSTQSKKGLASHMQFLQQKLSMNQKNHNQQQQFQQSQKDYFKAQQASQSKLIAQSLMASTANPNSSHSYRVKQQQSAGLTGHQKFL